MPVPALGHAFGVVSLKGGQQSNLRCRPRQPAVTTGKCKPNKIQASFIICVHSNQSGFYCDLFKLSVVLSYYS